MKKIFIVTVVFVCSIGLCVLGYCQDDSAIEQSESQIGQSLDSEISSEQAKGTAESSEASTEFQAGEPMTN